MSNLLREKGGRESDGLKTLVYPCWIPVRGRGGISQRNNIAANLDTDACDPWAYKCLNCGTE